MMHTHTVQGLISTVVEIMGVILEVFPQNCRVRLSLRVQLLQGQNISTYYNIPLTYLTSTFCLKLKRTSPDPMQLPSGPAGLHNSKGDG